MDFSNDILNQVTNQEYFLKLLCSVYELGMIYALLF